jgi:hypothetical protein
MVIDQNEESADGDDDSMVGVHTFKTVPNRIYWENDYSQVANTLIWNDLTDGSDQYLAEYTVPAGGSVTQVFSQARTIQAADELAAKVENLPVPTVDKPTTSVVTIIKNTVESVAPAVTQQSAQRARTCTVPRLRGRKRLAAERALVRAGCAVGKVKKAKAKGVKKGRIAKQSRAAGSIVAAGSRVNLTVKK